MASIVLIGDGRIDSELRRYYDEIEALAQMARQREIEQQEFEERMRRMVLAALLLAFLLGGGDATSRVGNDFIQEQRLLHERSISDLSATIYGGGYDVEGGGDMLANRLILWVTAVARVFNKGKQLAPPPPGMLATEEPRLRWIYDPRKEHCDDCALLHNVVLTVSEWARLGIEPQSPQLQCGGWRCGCRWEATDAPSIGLENVPLTFAAVAHHA